MLIQFCGVHSSIAGHIIQLMDTPPLGYVSLSSKISFPLALQFEGYRSKSSLSQSSASNILMYTLQIEFEFDLHLKFSPKEYPILHPHATT